MHSARPTTAVTMPGKVFERTHGGDGIWMLQGDGADGESQFGGGGEGVVAGAHGGGTGVGLLAVEGDGVALDALGAGNDGQGEAALFEDGALFDVEFKISGGVDLFPGGFADHVHIDAATFEGGREGLALVVGADAVRGDGVGAGEGGGAEQRAAETGAFFIGPVDQADGQGRIAFVVDGKGAQHFKAGQDAERAVEPAAVGDRIEMAAKQERPRALAGKRDPVVAGGIVVALHQVAVGQGVDQRLKPGAGLEPGGRPGDTLRALGVRGEGAQGFKMGKDLLRIDRHGYPSPCFAAKIFIRLNLDLDLQSGP